MEAMLSISRYPGECVHIGDAVVWITKVEGDRVRVAIYAPRDVKILRGELQRDETEQATERGSCIEQ
jgi:carbon storage regulator CsrA